MPASDDFRESSHAVQAHLTITQAVIGRMATNCASCKAWCITLVSAILVVVADKGRPNYALIALVPVLLFLALDAYYLALEKMFRKSYNGFIDKLHHGEVASSDLYAIEPSGYMSSNIRSALASFSVWPFYGTLAAMVLVAKRMVA